MRALCVGLLALPLLLANVARADHHGWVRVFDGKTLKGWKAGERPENWTVEDGVIVGRGARSHLYYVAKEFTDFEFKADILTQKKTNSGIYFHTRFQKEGWPAHGHESQVNVSHRDPVKTGSIYGVVKLYKTPAKDGEWWTQHIRVKDRNIRVTINGELVIDYTEPEGVKGTRKLSQGLFALQQHDPGSIVRYRNIMVKDLSESHAHASSPTGVHSFAMTDIDGNQKSLADFEGKVMLIVNVASQCGYTPQYKGLQALYSDHKDKGLVVLGVPSNDFGRQEPGSSKQIKDFCTSKFGVTFPMLAKVPVKNGNEQCDLYRFLCEKDRNGRLDANVSWNFNKFLVGKDGKPIKHYPSKVKPQDGQLLKDIQAALAQ